MSTSGLLNGWLPFFVTYHVIFKVTPPISQRGFIDSRLIYIYIHYVHSRLRYIYIYYVHNIYIYSFAYITIYSSRIWLITGGSTRNLPKRQGVGSSFQLQRASGRIRGWDASTARGMSRLAGHIATRLGG